MSKVFGSSYLISSVPRMHGGAQKVVYKVDCTNGFSCVLYVWDLAMNFFQQEIEQNNINAGSYGSGLFAASNRFLKEHSIRTPALYDLNNDRTDYKFDYALVEYIDGQKAEAYFSHPNPAVKEHVLQQIGTLVSAMHSIKRNTFGAPEQHYNEPNMDQCYLQLLENAKLQLAYAVQHIDLINTNKEKLLDKLNELADRIGPRSEYGLIHDELGPDHLLVNEKLEPYLIDIEGVRFFDIEHEHSFLEFRFGEYYRYLQNDSLDPDRMRFYRFHHHIALISAGLKLLHRGYPDQEFSRNLAKYHTELAIRYIDHKLF
ncbi:MULTISPECIES: phosphotransferase [unclassified Paenibacillus]|uniref:phosphotransferase n=1 Tax=unclassified Paenibacillus TaxID=185978 RepID=UPI002406A771|nr:MULTISPECIES: phosphotransferase [unclassified Paenibacillus]